MNERIWQLQGQAKVLAEQHIAHRKFDDVMEYRQVLYDTTMNKFAELIVAECIEVIDSRNRKQFHPTSTGGELLHNVAKDLREHFGVEA